MHIADVKESESEGEDGKDNDNNSEEDLRDQFNEIYDDPPDETPQADSAGDAVNADPEHQMDEIKNSDDTVQPMLCQSKNHSTGLSSVNQNCQVQVAVSLPVKIS